MDSWQVDFIITVGDNNYPDGAADTIDQNVGQFYQAYIFPYRGGYGSGAEQNRFFPTLGNHDWNTDRAQPYLEYFTLPGNERYYDFTWGAVHFFALDSDSREPDGINRSSAQAAWLQAQLAASTSPWNVVYLHHAPYSSGRHGATDWAQWPYKEWGADVVLAGHDHTYERLLVDDLLYFVNGVGGGAIYQFLLLEEGSQFRYNDDYGAMLVEASPAQMTLPVHQPQRGAHRRGYAREVITGRKLSRYPKSALTSRRGVVVRLRRSNIILMQKGAAHFMSNSLVSLAWLQSAAVAGGGAVAPSRSAPVDR